MPSHPFLWDPRFVVALINLGIFTQIIAGADFTNSSNSNLESTEQNNPCLSEKFEYNLENWIDSNAAQYYGEWSKDATRNERFHDRGEVNLFAREHWGDQSFFCSYEAPCTREPVCNEIWQHLSKIEGETEEVLQKTRKAYFATQAIIQINRFNNMKLKMMHLVQTNLVPRLAEIISDFTPHPDKLKDKEMRCGLLQDAIKAIYDYWVKLMFDAVEAIPLVKYFTAIPKLAYRILGHGVETEIDILLYKKYQSKQLADTPNSFDPLPNMQVTQRHAECGAEEHNQKDESFKRYGQFSRFLSLKFVLDRNVMNHLSVALNDGTFNDGSNDSDNVDGDIMTMANLMKVGFWSRPTAKARSMEANWERDLTTVYEQALISAVWSASRCYVKCQPHDDPAEKCDWESRYCSQEEKVVCQAQCWSSDSQDNDNIELYGMKVLGKYNLEGSEVVRSSWNSYKRHHNYGSIDRFNPNPGISRVGTFIELPVCFSSDNIIEDFRDGGNRAHGKIAFPFSCGDWRANETRRFMDLIGYRMESTNGEMNQEKAWWTFQHLLPWATRKMTPLRRFLVFCECQVHWPYGDSSMKNFKNLVFKKGLTKKLPLIYMKGADRRCAEVKAATEGMTGLEGNDWFCNEWGNARELFEEERAAFELKSTKRLGGLIHQSHKYLCEKSNKDGFGPDDLSEKAAPFTDYVKLVEDEQSQATWRQSTTEDGMQKNKDQE